MAKTPSKYQNMAHQEFVIYAYITTKLNAWQKAYKVKNARGVWVHAGIVIARSPWEATKLARIYNSQRDEIGLGDQRVAYRFRIANKLRAQPTFVRSR